MQKWNFAALLAVMICTASWSSAQDPRERTYLYPVWQPSHAEKPKVKGWATERVREKRSRGLVALPAGEGKVFLSWRLLEEDPTDIAFNLYREVPGRKPLRLTRQPLQTVTCFTDGGPLPKDPCS